MECDRDDGKNLVDFFIGELGFSPFLGTYRDQSPVFATIQQKNLFNFKYLVQNTRWGLRQHFTFGEREIIGSIDKNKYIIDEGDLTKFEEERLY